MRIMYLSFNNPLKCCGVYKKEISICRILSEELRKRGGSFKGVNIVVDECKPGLFFGTDCYTVRYVNFFSQPFIQKLKGFRSIINFLIRKTIAYKEIFGYKPDVVIYRYIWLPFIFSPKIFFKAPFLITTHQSKESDELSLSLMGRLIKKPVESLIFRHMFKDINIILADTTEIADYEIKRVGRDKPSFILPSGIDVEQYSAKRYKEIKNNRLELLFIATGPTPSHGLDRLFSGMVSYAGDANVFLHVVGELQNGYKDLVFKLGLEGKIIFHGVKHGEELNRLFDDSHIAIGTLALHRQNLRYGDPVKVREYLARGIPCVIAYEDVDIKNIFPYILRFPSDESPIDVKKIVEFGKMVYAKFGEGMIAEIRDYAKKNVDYRVKIPKLLDFIERHRQA